MKILLCTKRISGEESVSDFIATISPFDAFFEKKYCEHYDDWPVLRSAPFSDLGKYSIFYLDVAESEIENFKKCCKENSAVWVAAKRGEVLDNKFPEGVPIPNTIDRLIFTDAFGKEDRKEAEISGAPEQSP